MPADKEKIKEHNDKVQEKINEVLEKNGKEKVDLTDENPWNVGRYKSQ